MNDEMLQNVEGHKIIFVVRSTKSQQEYSIMIFKEKHEDTFRIINLTRGYICPCRFNTYEDAVNDIYKYQSEGKNEILDIYSMSI